MFGIGEYPPEYNAKIHGPYDPSRFYGKADAALRDVKLGELGSWIARRNYHPLNLGQAVVRGYWQWARRWLHVKRPGLAPYIQLIVLFSAFSYASQYGFVKYHRHTKYRW